MTATIAGQSAEALQGVGNAQVRLEFGGTRECVVGVAFGLLRLTLRDRHAGACGQRQRQVPARRCLHGVVSLAAARAQIPARQRGRRVECAPHRHMQGQDPQVPRGRPARVRRRGIPGGQGRDAQRRVGEARNIPTQLDRSLDGRVGRGPCRSRVTLIRECPALAR